VNIVSSKWLSLVLSLFGYDTNVIGSESGSCLLLATKQYHDSLHATL